MLITVARPVGLTPMQRQQPRPQTRMLPHRYTSRGNTATCNTPAVRQVHQHDAGNPGVYSVHGADSATGGACDGLTDAAWPALPAEEEGGAISVDFRPKGGPVASGVLAAQDGAGGILWSDGNFWVRVGDLEEEDEEEQLEEEAQPEQQRDSSTASPPIHFTGQYRDLQHSGCAPGASTRRRQPGRVQRAWS